MLLITQKLNLSEASELAEQAVEGIEAFFVQHPERQECHSNLWYDDVNISIKRGDVRKQVNDALDKLTHEDRFVTGP